MPAHEIDYKILGDDMQFVEVELDPGESTVAEAGAMMYMSGAIGMQTIFGDGSGQQGSGVMGMLLGAGRRLLTGESLFMTVFTNQGSGKQHVAFAAPYPGKILPMDLKQLGGSLICQKDSFLCAARGVSIGIAFQRRLGVGLFGGEGFIMQRLDGDGLCFVHAGGTIHELELQPGQTLRVDTGCIVALQPSVNYDIQLVGGVKTALFGGEGLFFATLNGSGPRLAAVASTEPACRAHLQSDSWDRRQPPRGRIDPRRHRRPAGRRFIEWLLRATPITRTGRDFPASPASSLSSRWSSLPSSRSGSRRL
jgi:uncharacterized protein (TIGR00266 family)